MPWTGVTWVKSKSRKAQASEAQSTVKDAGQPYALVDSGASHFLMPIRMANPAVVNSPDVQKIKLHLAIGKKDAIVHREEVFATGQASCLLPLGRVIQKLGMVAEWTSKGLTLKCPKSKGSKETIEVMTFIPKGNMQYATKSQFDADC